MQCKRESSCGASLSELVMYINMTHQTMLKQTEAKFYTFVWATISDAYVSWLSGGRGFGLVKN